MNTVTRVQLVPHPAPFGFGNMVPTRTRSGCIPGLFPLALRSVVIHPREGF